MPQHPWSDRRHHVNGGFRNPDAPSRDASPAEVASWLGGRVLSRKTNHPPQVVAPDPDALSVPPDRLRLTWLGHATVLVQTPEITLLTDPHFGTRASPLSFAGPERLSPVPLAVEHLPPIDLVVLSHDHYDHLDRGSVLDLDVRDVPLFAAPLGCADRLRDWGVSSVQAFDWWEYTDLAQGPRLHCTPAIHFSGRTPFDRNTTLWAGWMLDAEDARLFFAGDTAYGPHFQHVRERLGTPDAALLPIGAYLPRRIMHPVHVSPEEAMQAAVDLGRPHVVPIHWGTFDLANEPLHAPPAEAQRAAQDRRLADRLHVLRPGETLEV